MIDFLQLNSSIATLSQIDWSFNNGVIWFVMYGLIIAAMVTVASLTDSK